MRYFHGNLGNILSQALITECAFVERLPLQAEFSMEGLCVEYRGTIDRVSVQDGDAAGRDTLCRLLHSETQDPNNCN